MTRARIGHWRAPAGALARLLLCRTA